VLNLFEWWQRQNPDTPQLTQLNGLLKVLSAGGFKEEMGALWATYKAQAKDDHPRLVSDFLSAYHQSDMCDEVLAVYKEAQDSGAGSGQKFRQLCDASDDRQGVSAGCAVGCLHRLGREKQRYTF
jgi:hypothetical protein